jgi:Arc/MetJ-type ribon-helix-helix transcriptional regulator
MSMPARRTDPDNVQFSITLPRKAADALEVLVQTGLYGSSRATVAAEIIRQHLQELWKSNKLPG